MLHPSDFLAAYGRPTFTRVTDLASGSQLVEASPDRYLLAFFSATANIVISQSPEGLTAVPFAQIGNEPYPLILTHALHGSLVNEAWYVVTVPALAEITIVEGRMAGVPPMFRPGTRPAPAPNPTR